MLAYHSYMDTTDVSARQVARVSPATFSWGAAGGPGWMPALLVAASQEGDTERGHPLRRAAWKQACPSPGRGFLTPPAAPCNHHRGVAQLKSDWGLPFLARPGSVWECEKCVEDCPSAVGCPGLRRASGPLYILWVWMT